MKSERPNDDLVIRSVGEVPIAIFFVLAVATGALYWRRSQPLAVLGVTLVATAVSTGIASLELVGIAILVALYSTGRYTTDDRWSSIGLGGAFAVVGLSSFIDTVTLAEIGFGFVLTSWCGTSVDVSGSGRTPRAVPEP